MGAFDFAIGTLSSLSSALSLPKGTGKHTVNLNDLSIALDDHSQRAFSEFATGMQMLHKHSIHHDFNVAAIARENLKLLHTNLSVNPLYRNTITRIRSGAVTSNHWAWLPLFNDDSINAGLLYLPAGHNVAPHTEGANITIHQSELRLPFKEGIKNKLDHLLFLGLVGSSYINCGQQSHDTAPVKKAVSTSNNDFASASLCLKRGEAFVEEPPHRIVHRVFSHREPCLMLNVHLMLTH